MRRRTDHRRLFGLRFWLAVAVFPLVGQDAPEPPANISHHPPNAILNDRPFIMELMVDFAPESVASVALYMRSDSSRAYLELPMTGAFGRYRLIIPAAELEGDTLIYFFLVTMHDYGLWAYPTGEDGRIQPFVVARVAPTLEFFKQRLYD